MECSGLLRIPLLLEMNIMEGNAPDNVEKVLCKISVWEGIEI